MNWHATRSDDFRSPIVRGMARPEQAKDRVLSDDEIRAVWKATDVEVPDLCLDVRCLLDWFGSCY